jgi:hypothetical protein
VDAGFRIRSCFKQQHDPEKWMPVFGKDHASSNSMIPKSGFRFPACAKLCSAVTLVSRFGGRSQVGKDHALGNKLKRNTEST